MGTFRQDENFWKSIEVAEEFKGVKEVEMTVEEVREEIAYEESLGVNTLLQNLMALKDEKVIVKAIEDADGTMFQSDVVEKTGFSKVKVSRILDKLEGRQVLERKRRGMTNVVVLR